VEYPALDAQGSDEHLPAVIELLQTPAELMRELVPIIERVVTHLRSADLVATESIESIERLLAAYKRSQGREFGVKAGARALGSIYNLLLWCVKAMHAEETADVLARKIRSFGEATKEDLTALANTSPTDPIKFIVAVLIEG
jgi:hypothetical protein